MRACRTMGTSMGAGALLLAVACSSSPGGMGGPGDGGGKADAGGKGDAGHAGDGGHAGDAGGSPDPCGQIFDYLGRCRYGGATATELSRLKTRFTKQCDALVALPGAVGGSTLVKCGQAAQSAASCSTNTYSGLPSACQAFGIGTLPGGAKCVAGSQCQSGSCSTGDPGSLDGGSAPACGTCDPALADGRSCATPMSLCSPRSKCDSTSLKCVPLTFDGGVGTACDAPGDCLATLECNATGTDGSTGFTCQTPVGDAGVTTFAGPGQSCSVEGAQCLTGVCIATGPGPTGTCTGVIADGLSCIADDASAPNPSGCDAFASCVGGKCVLVPSAAGCM